MCSQGHCIVLKRGLAVVVQSCLTGGIVFGRGCSVFWKACAVLRGFELSIRVASNCLLRRIGLIRVVLHGLYELS